MPRRIEHRSVTPIVGMIRDIMRGRKSNEYPLRFADLLASRTQPPPNVPGGPYHRISKVYYYTRDARREVKPPIDVPLARQIESGGGKGKDVKQLTPGAVYTPKD